MGPWQATALVVGSIIGVGIFSLPYSLADRLISLVAMAWQPSGRSHWPWCSP